jgi:hypothetical protein
LQSRDRVNFGYATAAGCSAKRGTKDMKVFGKNVSDYIKFERRFLILILVVGLARLGLSLLGVANSVDKFLSLSVLGIIGLLYYSVRVCTSGFGGYKQLLPVLWLQWLVSQSIVVAGIVIAIAMSKDNIFSTPEYSPSARRHLEVADGRTWGHAEAHLILGIVILPLVSWLIGSLIMFVTKKIASTSKKEAGVAGRKISPTAYQR